MEKFREILHFQNLDINWTDRKKGGHMSRFTLCVSPCGARYVQRVLPVIEAVVLKKTAVLLEVNPIDGKNE
jgi:hypothetical protein